MSLPSWLFRETERNPRHSWISIFVGPDADHRANAGAVCLDHEQADDLFDLVRGAHAARQRVEVQRAPLPEQSIPPAE